MKYLSIRPSALVAALSLGVLQGFAAREAAANMVCGLGRIQTLAIGNEVTRSGLNLWLEVEPEFVNETEGPRQYRGINLVRLSRAGDADLFQRQMQILLSAYTRGARIRIVSDKTTTPKCDGTVDDYQISTCDFYTCDTLGWD